MRPLVPEQAPDVGRHHRARRAAARHQPSAPPERAERLGPRRLPTMSTTTSTPRFCVRARISFPTSTPRWLSVSSAPSATARSSFASLPEVTARTRAEQLARSGAHAERDAAADPPDQHVVARPHARARDEHAPRGERRERERRGLRPDPHRPESRARSPPAPRRARVSVPGGARPACRTGDRAGCSPARQYSHVRSLSPGLISTRSPTSTPAHRGADRVDRSHRVGAEDPRRHDA